MKKLFFYNRYTNAVEEEPVMYGKMLQLLYSTTIGQLSMLLLIKRKIFSMLLGWWYSRPASRRQIPQFIEKFDIKQDSFEKKVTDFTSFNDFFVRKLKPYCRPIAPNYDVISSSVDGRHLAYEDVNDIDSFFVKGEVLDIDDLIKNEKLARQFAHGSILFSRLSIFDYHRFHFPVTCTPGKTFLINGKYSSVHPFAVKENIGIFLENKRMSTLLHTKKCGDILMIEIGATGVGSIKQTFTPNELILRGSEKGFFEFGGSTVILIFEKGKIKFSDDLLTNTHNGLETYILMGDEIARIVQ